MYVLKFTDDGLADIKGLDKSVRNSLKQPLLERVAADPDGCSQSLSEPLEGYRSFHWRDYRIVYKVYHELRAVAVVGVGKKSSQAHITIYKRLEALAQTGKLAESVMISLKGFTKTVEADDH